MSYSPFFDQEPPDVPVVGLIAEADQSPSWELDACAVFECEPGKGYLVVEVSGCSCWPDRGGTTQKHCPDKVDVDRALAGGNYTALIAECQTANWKATKVETE